MRIEFRRAGGFAAPAMKQSYSIDSDDLPAEEAERLQQLVEGSDVVSLAGRPVGPPPRPDAFYYQVTIEDGGVRHAIKASDADMPASLRPLIDWLTERASSRG